MSFKTTDSKINFPELEKKILEFWRKEKIFNKTQIKKKGQKNFVLYEGPPTANGKPGLHHVLARSFKDLYPRYKTMQGFYCPRRGGWDCHGLPVELEVEKELGFSGKKDIEKYGIASFNQKCKESVLRYIGDWENLTGRMGFWIDLENAYFTFKNEYIETCWWLLKELYNKDLLVRDYKVLPYCPRCGTPLSSHELALGYQDVAENSVYLKFELQDEPGTFLLAWTTTPWTLPGNVALAVDPKSIYIKVKENNEKLILAKERRSILTKEAEIEEEFSGEELLGKSYKPLFAFIKHEKKAHFVIDGSDFVLMDEGTGIVHTAVMYGADDFVAGKKAGLPEKHTVTAEGKFTEEVKPWQGQDIFAANPLVIEDLKNRGILYKEEKIVHSYPFCWRCRKPLIYYALESWFIKTTAKQKEIIEQNQKINWVPESVKEGRMGNWLQTMVDWALSRSRYWGTPLPVWLCEKCGETNVIGSLAELRERAVDSSLFKEGFDLHRPFIDEIKIKCQKCGGEVKRVESVIDCWFDSGSMPYGQWHYPFENKEKFSEEFPADFIAEGQDQTRGWFYTLLVIATLVSGRSSYQNVICHNLVLDEKGQKMSKSQGNVIDPWEVMEKYGADALRWYFYSSVSLGGEYRFGFSQVEEVVRRFFLTLWNVYHFFVTYANVDSWQPKNNKPYAISNKHILDRWILSKLNQLIRTVTESLEKYDAFTASRAIEDFVTDLSTWYLRRSRERVGPTAKPGEDKNTCYQTLYEVLITLNKLLAPFAPFLAEEIYQNLKTEKLKNRKTESVHLEDWPMANQSDINISFNEEMEYVRKICELGHAQRKEAKIRVRQPLSQFSIFNFQFSINNELIDLIKAELNVKEVRFVKGKGELKVELDTKITPQLAAEGEARELVRRIQEARKEKGCALDEKIIVTLPAWPKEFEDWIKKQTLAEALEEGSFGIRAI